MSWVGNFPEPDERRPQLSVWLELVIKGLLVLVGLATSCLISVSVYDSLPDTFSQLSHWVDTLEGEAYILGFLLVWAALIMFWLLFISPIYLMQRVFKDVNTYIYLLAAIPIIAVLGLAWLLLTGTDPFSGVGAN